jgi:RNA polymerase sigma-70 factor, ECF subfamily
MNACGEMVVEQPLGLIPKDEDERLWRAAAAGDRGAFEDLVKRHSRILASVAARLLGSQDEVEDAVQETFLRAYRTMSRFRGECTVRAWLVSITVNICRTRRRGLGRWRELLARSGSFLTPAAPDPRREAEHRLTRAEVDRALAALPENLRVPFVLRFYEELSGVEIAAALGWNESTVWSRIYAAQRKLRQLFQDETE